MKGAVVRADTGDVYGQDRGGYYVRMHHGAGATLNDRDPANDPVRATVKGAPRPRRHATFSVRPLPVLALILAGWLGWASTTDGGASARIEEYIDTVRGAVTDATTDPGLKRASIFYNDLYSAEAGYPNLSDEYLQSSAEGNWSIGVQVEWCGPRAIVLRGLTGGGTVSRLLLDGRDLGDVHGAAICPADLADPRPWEPPTR